MLFSSPSKQLLKACEKGDLEALKKLLEYSAIDVNVKNKIGDTPLIIAAKNGRTEMARLLLDRGADMNKISGWGNAFLWAANNGHTDIVALLLDRGADVNAPAAGNWTALLAASRNGHATTVRLLLNRGAVIEKKNDQGHTALVWAEHRGHSYIAQMLHDALEPKRKKEQEEKQKRAAAEAVERQKREKEAMKPKENWVLMSPSKVAFIGIYPEMKRKLTEIFNFESREKIIISENTATNTETTSQPVPFGDLDENGLRKAFDEFVRQGGKADEALVFKPAVAARRLSK